MLRGKTMDSSRPRHVYTPGSVDSWDMENLQFLRKISKAGGGGGGHNNNGLESDLDTLSYVSDGDSAVYYDDEDHAVDESEDEKGHVLHNHHHHQNQHSSASIYVQRGDHPEHSVDGESEYGMSSNESEVQSPTRLLDEALYSGGNGFALLNKAIVMKQMKTMAASTRTLKDPYLEDDAESDIIEPLPVIRSRCNAAGGLTKRTTGRSDDFDRRFMKSRKPKPSLVTLGFMEPQLEDCYVLDVVTVRNESVLAERGGRVGGSNTMSLSALSDNSQDSEGEGMEKMLKLNGNCRRNGSAGLPSSSSSSVSSEEFNSAREGFFPSVDDDHIEVHRDYSPEDDENRATCSPSPVSVVVRGECTTRIPVGYSQSSERSFATASSNSNYYYLGQQQEDFQPFESNSNTGSGKERMVETPRSISPYYVRLRRDLIPPSYTPPHPRQPWNFGMNRQGLLVIDYSPNWDGLETYVRNLSLQS